MMLHYDIYSKVGNMLELKVMWLHICTDLALYVDGVDLSF